MATVSSHILDSITGKSAIGIRVQLIRRVSGPEAEVVFDTVSDKEGRIVEQIEAQDGEYELIFYVADYFAVDPAIVKTAVIRFAMSDNQKRYHMPLILSPHSYSVWWSD